MITKGEWEAEVRPNDSEDEKEWQQVCTNCTIDIKANFIPDDPEDDYET